ncbi:calpain clp-1-like [Penaeus japonicus]|uniref:calpain clp-1-like n=1 Tax=Penaeus japonicus TaxID=27405 RepID=UPI001C70E2DA|nr:calpain clp-1-like [Penaeus japonicus]
MSEKENEEVVRCVTSKIVNALVSQEDGMRGDVSNDLLTKVAADAVRTYSSGGGQSGQQYQGQQGGQGGDLVSSVASSVIGNLFSGDGGESTKQKTGLDDRMVAGIVSHVVRGIRGRPQLPEGEADGVNDDVVATVTSSVIKEIVSQDTEGKILTSNDPGVNSSIVSNIASKIVQNIMTSDTPEAKDLKAAAAAATHAGGGAGGGGEDLPLEGKNKGLLEGLVSDVVGGLIGGGGGGGSAGGGGQRNKDDVLSGIASNVIGGLVGGGGGGGKPSMSGGAIASNIIGKIVSNKLGQGVVGDVVKETSTDVLAEVMEGAIGPQFSRKGG